ncbi:MAG: hypothetical protein IPJ65_43950 [Archangiaceae bacterium]|nr:hypothetical protein [Archangiaceae bacterium]
MTRRLQRRAGAERPAAARGAERPGGVAKPASEAAPAPQAFDDHPLRHNPYSFDAAGQRPPSAERLRSFERPGLRAGSDLGFEVREVGQPAPSRPRDALLASVAQHPHREGAIAAGVPSVAELFPPLSDFAAARSASDAALGAFEVQRADGTARTRLLERIGAAPFSDLQRERVLDCFAEFHHALGLRDFDRGSSDVNWKHICAEAAQVLDACELRGLSPDATEDALLASLFSDAVKFPSTLLTHNIDGAVGAYHVLARRHFDLSQPAQRDRLAGIVAATKEHQISPPGFMAMIAGFNLERVAPGDPRVEPVRAKLADPLNPRWVELDGAGAARIAFTPDERALLQRIGIDEWPVPDPRTPWFEASSAVIAGDSIVNYAMPEGVGKIVAISGPGTAFEAPTVFDAVFSCGVSFLDARRVIRPELEGQYAAAAEGTREVISAAVDRLGRELAGGALTFSRDALAAIAAQEHVDLQQLETAEAPGGGDVRVQVPSRDLGHIPFFSAPLDTATHDAHYEFAKLIRRRLADLLRDHFSWYAAGERS